MAAQGKVRRLWARDASLWTGRDEAQWLGWLGITNGQLAHIERLTGYHEKPPGAPASPHVLLLGMGGSSLCPEVMKTTFGTISGFPELHVLDSTDPAQVKAFENKVDLKNTLFIVSSKSGSTLEPNVFKQYFFDRVKRLVGAKEAGRRFVAITDPGSKLQQVAEGDGFRHVFLGWPNIGGRYSALSDFGLVPAAIMGVDVAKFLDRTEEMVCACMPSVPVEENPGVVLGTILGVAAQPIRPRQADDRRVAGDLRSRRLAGAAGGRVDGQGRQGIDPDRSRSARHARRLWPRSPVRLSAIAVGTGRGAGRGRRRAGTRRSPGGAHRGRRSVRPGRGVLPLGDRHRGGRLDPRHPPLRPAGRGSEQDRDAEADRRVREDRGAARGDADLHGRRDRALHGREECGGAGERGERHARRWRGISRRISTGSTRATTLRFWPTSR